MRSRMVIGALAGVGLVVLAIWLWQGAEEVVLSWRSRRVGLWAVWSGALAAAALGQLVLLKFVAESVYRRRGGALPWLLAGVGVVGLGCAVGLGVVAR